MKKVLVSIIMFFCALTGCIFVSGCSCGGDIINCLTNGIGSILITCGNCNNCVVNRMIFGCSTCTCLECQNCYSDCFVSSCYHSGEDCKNYTCTNDTEKLQADGPLYSINTVSNMITELELLREDVVGHSIIDLKVTGKISIEFVGENIKFDNVSVICELNCGDNEPITSTCWLGSVKCGKTYTVTPEYYLFNNGKYSYDSSNYWLTYYVIGKEVT